MLIWARTKSINEELISDFEIWRVNLSVDSFVFENPIELQISNYQYLGPQ